jgi:succinate dehydrogenase / fumarate reductase, iron-sulfur subunit
MRLNLKVWRQPARDAAGRMVEYAAEHVSPDMSFLEMLDVVNDTLIRKGEDPIAFDSDCREGICGSCGLVVDGVPHGPDPGGTVCQLHMRKFKDGDTITVEPWRAAAFPVIKDLVVDRSAFDRIIAAGGYVSVSTGQAPEANAIPIRRDIVETAMDSAACIACGACVAACKNASASLFTAAKISHLGLLPQGQVERHQRVVAMVDQMDAEGFGHCTNEAECQAVCPKEIPIATIARMYRDYFTATVRGGREPAGAARATAPPRSRAASERGGRDG